MHMKNLDTKEWVAVVVSVFVVGFFFIFGPGLISLFTSNKINTVQTQELGVKDEVIGGGEIATLGSRVTVHYTGRFMDGAVFDSSVSRNEPFQFLLGGGQVIAGWDKGLVDMRVGGKRVLTIPSNLGYGTEDFGPIPGGSTLIFDIELLKVEK